MGRLNHIAFPHRTGRLGQVGLLAALLLAGPGANVTAGQGLFDRIRTRPRLPSGQDTNSAAAYYFNGVSLLERSAEKAPSAFSWVSILERNAEKAASSFYWASRLDPSWAAPLYGQYAAMLLAEPPSILAGYLTSREVALRDPVLLRIDSLDYLAILKNPFVERRFDGLVLSTWLYRETNGRADMRDLGLYNRSITAWAAYGRGDFKMAAAVYAEVIKQHPDNPDLRFWRALSFFAQGQSDSARATLQAALARTRSMEWKSPLGWVSHPFTEYSVGFLFELGGQHDSAQAAYERALLDDLTFHPAYRRLAALRLAAHDTTGAMREFTHAVTLDPKNAGYLYDLGMLLLAAGRHDSSAAVLRQAASAEPFYALPHYPLGVIYEHSGFTREAADHYEAFLRLAPRSMATAIAAVRERLKALTVPSPEP